MQVADFEVEVLNFLPATFLGLIEGFLQPLNTFLDAEFLPRSRDSHFLYAVRTLRNGSGITASLHAHRGFGILHNGWC